MAGISILAEKVLNGIKIRCVKGDLTERDVDAIVNAANSRLQHGGGVAGAIVRRGGDIIQEESDKIGYVPVGEAAITTAGALKARFVIHTVGPRMGEGGEDEKLASAIESSLRLAEGNKLKSISFPAVSSGIFGFPKDRCASILVGTAARFAKATSRGRNLELIEFCLFDDDTAKLFARELERFS
jgi:O-acetyl-ADP-ribose deacetylase (regulator of RNase III)